VTTTDHRAAPPTYRRAPRGFSAQQRAEFDRDGVLVVPGAIDPDDVARYLDAVDRVPGPHDFDRYPTYVRENVVELDPALEELIDHERHVGFVYDLFGEQLMLHSSQVFVRGGPTGPGNQWHPDGPRAVPYGVFTARPLQVKIAYWLTDVPAPRMANLVVRPGSQHQEYFDGYDTWDSVGDELVLCPQAGDMLIMHAGVWHRVEPNDTNVVRKNLFLTYCPSWIVPGDRYTSDETWLATLPRERRIIMRSYAYPYNHAKPPADDFPLFLDRETGADRDPDAYREHVALERRKRKLADEA
jgi:Phytanoyl-CoA dioxygenase (PhyH)